MKTTHEQLPLNSAHELLAIPQKVFDITVSVVLVHGYLVTVFSVQVLQYLESNVCSHVIDNFRAEQFASFFFTIPGKGFHLIVFLLFLVVVVLDS